MDSTRAVESDTQEMITNPEDTSTTTSIVFAQEKAGYKGVWVPFDDGFQLYLRLTGIHMNCQKKR